MAILLLAYRRLERDRLLRDLEYLADLIDRHIEFLRYLFRQRIAAQLLNELSRDPDQLIDRLDHMHRYSDSPRLIGYGSRYRLSDPPGGVRRELITLCVIELLDGFYKA